jgi:hypothetical protein
VSRAGGGQKWLLMDSGFFAGDENILEIDSNGSCVPF